MIEASLLVIFSPTHAHVAFLELQRLRYVDDVVFVNG
jgi:hypothetical protein